MMVVLSAQDSDKHINEVAKPFFEAFPTMKALSKATEETLFPIIKSVRNFGNKTKWLLELSAKIKEDKNIPETMEVVAEYGVPFPQGDIDALADAIVELAAEPMQAAAIGGAILGP